MSQMWAYPFRKILKYVKNYWRRRPDDSRETGGKEDQGRKVDLEPHIRLRQHKY